MKTTNIYNFERRIYSLINSGNFNAALAKIQLIVDRTFCEPLIVGQVFSSEILDQFCQTIGMINKEKSINSRQNPAANKKCTNYNMIFLVSKLQLSGGHSAVIFDIIKHSPNAKTLIIITGTCGKSDSIIINDFIDEIIDVDIEHTPPGNHLSKLTWIQQILYSSNPDTVWLFNHHQDSVAVSAVQPGMGYALMFCHHGDHHLCLGVHLDYATHIDLHPMGFHNCRNTLGIENNRYLPLVAKDRGVRNVSESRTVNKNFITCTAAGSNKVEIPYLYQYTEVIPNILRCTKGIHIHIGRLTFLSRRRIYLGLKRANIEPNSFVYIPQVDSVWDTLLENKVDLYISSFPYGGGRTLVEVMGAGIPSIVHYNAVSRMLGAHDLVYDGAFVWHQDISLYEHLNQIDNDNLINQGRAAREWYEKYHTEENLKNAVSEGIFGTEAPTVKNDHHPDHLHTALLYITGITFLGVINRLMYRYYRQLKSMIGRRFSYSSKM